MNLVLDESFEEKAGGEKAAIGMVVRPNISGRYICVCGNFAKGKIYQVIRGNSIVMLEVRIFSISAVCTLRPQIANGLLSRQALERINEK